MNDTIIGLDSITMEVIGKCPKNIVQRIEKRNRQGRLYLAVDKTKQTDVYNMIIILPSIIRPSNLQGFSLLDSVKLECVIDVVKKDLHEIFGTRDLDRLKIKKIEVNANKGVPQKINVDVIISFISRALLKTNVQQIEHCHGLNLKQTKTIKTKVTDGFITDRDSSGRYRCKFYRKDRQLGLENKIKPTLRMEIVYNTRGVTQALGKKGIVTLTDILQKSAMQKLIQRFVVDVRQSIMPPIRLYLEDATNLVLTDLKHGYGAYKTFLKWYDVIQYDYRIFRTALKKYYRIMGNEEQSASVQASRIKARALEEEIVINEGVVKQLEELFREIRLQEI